MYCNITRCPLIVLVNFPIILTSYDFLVDRSACVFFKIPVKNIKSTVTPFSVLMRFGTAGLMI